MIFCEIMIQVFRNSFAYNWGTTQEERSHGFPCDKYLSDVDDTIFRAVTIRAKQSTVYKWVCQLRVAPYSYDWLDNHGHKSPRELLQGLDKLTVGLRFMEAFELAEFQQDVHITIRSINSAFERAFGKIVVSYVVSSTSASETRLIVKLLIRRTDCRRFSWIGPLLPWGDFIMMRKQLLTLKKLSEGE